MSNQIKILDTVSSDLNSSDSKISFGNKKNKKIIKSGEEEKNYKEKHKNFNGIEFDLVLKNICGENLKKFLNEMKQQKRLFQYSSYTELKNDIKYNVCVEITM